MPGLSKTTVVSPYVARSLVRNEQGRRCRSRSLPRGTASDGILAGPSHTGGPLSCAIKTSDSQYVVHLFSRDRATHMYAMESVRRSTFLLCHTCTCLFERKASSLIDFPSSDLHT